MERIKSLTALFLSLILSFQTLFFAMPTRAMAAADALAPQGGAVNESTATLFAKTDKKVIDTTTSVISLADFSESAVKGPGFRLSDTKGRFVDFRLKDFAPMSPLTLGNTTVFNLPGATVKYTRDNRSLKEEITLAARPATNEIAFNYSSSKLSPQADKDGGYALLTTEQEPAFKITAPTIVDADGKSGKISLDFTAADQAVLKIDPAFLDGAAYPVTIDPTVIALSNGGAGLSSQRNIFYDPVYGKYWVMYSDGTNYRASYSTDGISWSQSSSTISSVTSGVYLATRARTDGTVFVAYRRGYSIYARKGTLGSTTIAWGTEYQVFSGTATLYYTYPAIQQDSSGKVWVAAKYFDGTYHKIQAKRSTAAQSVSAWDAVQAVSANSSSAYLIPQILQLPSSQMYFLWLHGTEIRGRLYNGSGWAAGVTITSTYSADFAHIPSAVVNGSNTIYMGYPDTANYPQYRTLASPYTGWSGASSLVTGDTGDNVVLTHETASGNIYGFYGSPPGTSQQLRQVRLGDPANKLNQNGGALNEDQIIAPYTTGDKTCVTWRVGTTIYFAKKRVVPSTSLSINPTSPDGANGWYKTAPAITLSATADWAPLTTYYKWNSGSWTQYTGAFTNAPQGANTLYYYSVDDANNQEATKSYPNLKVDTIAPTNPTATSPSHTVDATSYDNTIDISMSGASDAASGLDGYSIEWSQSAGTTPDSTVDLGAGATSTASPQLANGAWYFHLKTKDLAGNWSNAVHLGPFYMAGGLTGLEGNTSAYSKATKAANLTVNLANGNLVAQVAGLSRPARGLPVAISHTYNSGETTDSPFGYGWTLNYSRNLTTDSVTNSKIYRDEDGSHHFFAYNASTGLYMRPPGVFLALIKNGDGTLTLTDKAGVKSNFDASGILTSVVDKNGNSAVMTYTSGQLTKITDASGADTTLAYSNGRLSQITTADGRTNGYGYNGSGDLAAVINAADTTSATFAYANHRLTGVTDALGRDTGLSYANDKVSSITDPAPFSYQTTFTYNSASTIVDGPRTDVSDVTTYTIAPSGLLTGLAEPAPGGVTIYGYDSDNNMTSITKPNTALTTYTYDGSGNRLSETNPLNHTSYWSYNANNDVINSTDALGFKTSYTYDATGNLTKKVNADDTSETYVNNQYGQRTKLTNARGYWTDFTYTSLGQVYQEIKQNGAMVTGHEYDLAGNETTTTDPLQRKTTQAYDRLGQSLSGKDPGGGETYSEYDPVGNKLKESRLADLQIADMETDEAWSGATTDTVIFKQGVRGRKVTSVNGVAALMSRSFSLNLAGEDTSGGSIDEWVYIDDAGALDPGAAIQITFDSTASSSFSYQVPKAGLNNGWNQLHIAKSSFSPSGSPSWAEITGVANTARSVFGQTVNVTFDDLRLVANKRKVSASTYDELGRLKTQTDALGNSTGVTYDAAGNKLSESDSKGTTNYTYDALNHQKTVTDPNSNTTTNTVDSVGNIISVEDPRHKVTTYDYDLAGRQTSQTDPEGMVTGYTYDRLGNKTSEGVDSLSVADFEADESWLGGTIDASVYREGHQSRALETDGSSSEFSTTRDVSLDLSTSDHFNIPIWINSTDAMGWIGLVFYTGTDWAKREFSATDFYGSYNDGWRPKTINKAEFTKTANFDWANVTKIKLYAIGTWQQLQVKFDGLSLGDRTLNRYDKVGRLTGVNDKNGGLTAYQYDNNGNQVRITPPQSSMSGDTINTYDDVDRLISSTDGAGKTTGHAYDLAGRETTTTLPTGVIKTAAYDTGGRLLSISAPDSTTTFAYDTQGDKIVQQRVGGLSEYFTFDDAGRQIKTVNSEGRIKADNLDVKGKSTYILDQNGRVDYTYDAGSRLTDMKVESETSSTFGYDANSNRTSYIQANGVKTAYGYDDDNRLTSLDASKTGARLFKIAYGYDEQGNITTETVVGGSTTKYTYDADSQLRTWVLDSSTTTYTYDAGGNITAIDGPGKNATLGYGADNRLNGAVINGAYTGYSYDNSGNMTQKAGPGGNVDYTWNSNNELIHISGPSLEATYTYDAEGKRTGKTINGVTTQFVYDDIKLVAEKDGSGALTATYFYDDKGQLVSMKKGGQSYYFHLNHRGDVIRITDSSQNTTASYSYDPWGNILDSTGTFADQQPFRYASYYWDGEIGMYYLMARYYDPGVGRFVSKDPAGDPENDDGRAQEVNAYIYANNNPNAFVDPSGETAVIVLAAAIILVTVGYVAFIIWFSRPETQQAINDLEDAIEGEAREALRGFIKTAKEINGWAVRVEQHGKGKAHAHWKKGGKKGSVNQDGSKHHKNEKNTPGKRVKKWLRDKAGFNL